MADVGFPGQHTTTTTVRSNTTVDKNIRFDPLYIRTPSGILKIAQVLLSLISFICVQASPWRNWSNASFFSAISMIAFWFTGILLGLYLFHIVEKFYKIPWLKVELGFCAIWTFFYLLAASLVVGGFGSALSAAAFFGYSAMLVYGIDAGLKFRAVRAGELAQGTRVVSKETSTVTTPPPREGY